MKLFCGFEILIIHIKEIGACRTKSKYLFKNEVCFGVCFGARMILFWMILFWQPTYTDFTSNNGLMGFLMDRIVTTMVMGRIATTMVFSSILFWQPTYTNLTVSNNGLLGFLMGRIVTTMVLGRIATTLIGS